MEEHTDCFLVPFPGTLRTQPPLRTEVSIVVALLKLLSKAHSAQEVVQGSAVWGPTDI